MSHGGHGMTFGAVFRKSETAAQVDGSGQNESCRQDALFEVFHARIVLLLTLLVKWVEDV